MCRTGRLKQKKGVKQNWWMEQMLESVGGDESPGPPAPRGLVLDWCLPDRWPLRAPSFTSVCSNAHPSVFLGIRDCCAVWRHRLMIPYLFCHISLYTIGTEGKKTKENKGNTVLVISSFRLQLMNRLSDTGWARTLQPWTITQTLEQLSREPHNCQLQSLSEPCMAPPQFWEPSKFRWAAALVFSHMATIYATQIYIVFILL